MYLSLTIITDGNKTMKITFVPILGAMFFTTQKGIKNVFQYK
jgi:hypothetical protein